MPCFGVPSRASPSRGIVVAAIDPSRLACSNEGREPQLPRPQSWRRGVRWPLAIRLAGGGIDACLERAQAARFREKRPALKLRRRDRHGVLLELGAPTLD